jgi:RimJ/RimL family protein N-acetyltransferase
MPAIRLEPFSPAHVALIEDAGQQEWAREYFEDSAIEAAAGDAVSIYAEGEFFGCAGVVEIHKFRALVWAILVPGHRRHWLEFNRVARAWITERLKTYPRIEAYTDPDFPQAQRWMKVLGFRQEGAIKPYFFPDGRACAEWVLLRGD